MMTLSKVTAKELSKKLNETNEIMILDVRAKEKYETYHIEGATNIPKTTIFGLEEEGLGKNLELPKDKEIVVTCTTGNSARKCAEILASKDYKVTVLDGGLTAWKEYIQVKGD